MLETMTALFGAAGGLIGLTKEATGLVNDIKHLVEKPDIDTVATKKLISDLLDRLITLQTEQIAMQSAILEFREEQRRIEHFKAEADRYALRRTELGSLVYELKPGQADAEPTHWICAACYDKQIKSVLQPVAHNTFECGTCKSRVFMPDGRDSGIMVGRVSRRGIFDGLA